MSGRPTAEKDVPCCAHPKCPGGILCCCPPVENDVHIDLAVDANGERYTTHTFAKNGDPWRGATILTPGVVRRLREGGLLPLTECPMCHNGHPFVPGVSTDHAPGESDPRWCNTCGEARVFPPGREDE